jgi:hypothetical protein
MASPLQALVMRRALLHIPRSKPLVESVAILAQTFQMELDLKHNV